MKQFNIYLILLLFLAITLSFGFSFQKQDEASLHMFIIADTDDTTIGAIADFPKMQQEAQRIARLSKLKLKEHYHEKKNISASSLIKKIKELQVGADDVIWFYYTGHGFNSKDGLGKFPGFALDNTQFSLEWVHKTFSKKNARLVISMFDCCNWKAEKRTNSSEGILLDSPKRQNYFALFRESQGSIKIASNTSGYKKYSYGNSDYGGFFSIAFRDVLDNQLKGKYNDCTWNNLLQESKDLTKKRVSQLDGNKEQIPYYEINIFRYN